MLDRQPIREKELTIGLVAMQWNWWVLSSYPRPEFEALGCPHWIG